MEEPAKQKYSAAPKWTPTGELNLAELLEKQQLPRPVFRGFNLAADSRL